MGVASGSSSFTLVILAAGLGSRYEGLKQVDTFGLSGEWLMDYAIHDAWRSGFERVIVILRSEIRSEVVDHLSSRWSKEVDLEFVEQSIPGFPDRQKPWGTTHAILSCRGIVSGPFLLINADDFYGRRAYELMADHFRNYPTEWGLVSYPLASTLSSSGGVSRGICHVDRESFLLGISEHELVMRSGEEIRDASDRSLSMNAPASMNFFGFTFPFFDHFLPAWEEFHKEHEGSLDAELQLPGTIHDLVRSGKVSVRVYEAPREWLGVTYRAERDSVFKALCDQQRDGLYPIELGSV
ncbi:MAG: sugar phosphate nucleotidyltransferase [Cytophagales bacterium]|nr:sugar phosphate nucleotidyltransferase [Cytophagales bacterium]